MRTVPDTVAQGYLDQAAKRLSEDELGDAYDEAHGNLAAHMIVSSPGGISSRMVNKDGTSTYSTIVDAIKQAFCHAVDVT
jgi:hypothetical protein